MNKEEIEEINNPETSNKRKRQLILISNTRMINDTKEIEVKE